MTITEGLLEWQGFWLFLMSPRTAHAQSFSRSP